MSIKRTFNIVTPFGLLIFLFVLITHVFFEVTKVTIFKYILTQCLVIMAPGLVCVKYLFGQKEKLITHWVFLSYALGYCVNIIEYIIIWGLHLQQFAPAIVSTVSLLFCFLWFYKPIEVEFEGITQSDYILLFLIIVYEVINIISYSGNNISPFIGNGATNIARDIQFWCANAVSLKNGFLPETAYYSGTTFFYHYFSSMHIAFISQVSGISIFDIAFTLYSFGKSILLIGSLNYLIDRYKLGNIKFIFYLSVLFMTGWEKKSIVTYGWHLHYNPFGFDIGFAFGVWFLAFMMDLCDDKEFAIGQYITVVLIWFTLTGVKGPIAMLIMIIPGFICFTRLFQKRFKIAFLYGFTILSIFVVVNIVCVGIIRILNHTAESQSDDIGGFRTVYQVISETPYVVRYRNIIPSMIWYAYNTHPFLFILTVINTILIIWMLVIKKIQIEDCFKISILLFTVLFGFIVGRFYNAGGRSEMYFTMAAYIPCLVYNLEIYREMLVRDIMHVQWRDISYKIALIIFSMIGLYCWGFTDYLGGIINPLNTGRDRIAGNWETAANNSSFTKREAEACLWIRNNTSQDSIIQSNRFVAYPTGSYFASIFSERIQYLEETFLIYYCDLGIEEPHIESREAARRSEIIKNAYEGDINALNQMIDEGVDYFLQDNLLNENMLANMGLNEVYNNNDIIIYSVK